MMSSSVSIEALAMAGADYLDCNLMLDEEEDGYATALPPPHLLADDDDDDDVEGEEFSWKIQIIKRSIRAMMSLDNTDVHYEKPKTDDDMANEEDLITNSEMNIIGRTDQEEVVDLSKLLMSFTTFLKREKLEGAANIPASQDYKQNIQY
nr:hypothetical protein GOBAR_AA06977 [Ipomoea trifida]